MSGFWILFKKETKDSFCSPFVYIITSLFCLVIGWIFFNYLLASNELTNTSLTNSILIPVFGVMNSMFMFFSPLLTMGKIAEEKKSGTLDLLLMSKLKPSSIIISKLMSSFLIVLFMLSFTLVFPIILYFSGYTDWGIVFSNYLGVIFTSLCYLSVGLFASSLTENQIVAVFSSFCMILCLNLLSLTSTSVNNYIFSLLLRYFSLGFHVSPLIQGSLKSFSFIFFFSFMGIFLYMTKKSLESRRW